MDWYIANINCYSRNTPINKQNNIAVKSTHPPNKTGKSIMNYMSCKDIGRLNMNCPTDMYLPDNYQHTKKMTPPSNN